MRVVSVVGNRPQFVKAAPLHLALAPLADVVMVDTGQHYDHGLAGIFYDELGIAPPAHRLEVGSGTHAETTARVLERIEPVLAAAAPDWVVVYGDTNSTLAAALAASKLGLPVAHVEAGLRSFDRSMPEEVNRVLVDAVADLLLCPSDVAVRNLAAEGITRGVHVVGDVMADAARLFGPLADRVGRPDPPYVLATIHREANTRQPALGRLVDGAVGPRRARDPAAAPAHPRGRRGAAWSSVPPSRCASRPATSSSRRCCAAPGALVTDSGGAQKEAYFHGIPCVTLRDTTEWVETVGVGLERPRRRRCRRDPRGPGAAVPAARPELYGDGHAAERIAALLAQTTSGVSPDGSTR